MPEYDELSVDKFIFRFDKSCFYSEEGVWARAEGDYVRMGLSDYAQQRSGDVAFIELKPAGARLAFGDEAAVIETIKVNIILGSPTSGEVAAVNSVLDASPEIINQDPFGEGWMLLIKPDAWALDQARLLDSQAYFEWVKKQVEEETR
jgi:glycine cleavage system H protein